MRISDWSSDVCSSDLESAADCLAETNRPPERRSPPRSIVHAGSSYPLLGHPCHKGAITSASYPIVRAPLHCLWRYPYWCALFGEDNFPNTMTNASTNGTIHMRAYMCGLATEKIRKVESTDRPSAAACLSTQ